MPTPRARTNLPQSLSTGDGCGNRFLLISACALAQAQESAEDLAPQLCGSVYDGLLILGPPTARAQEVRIVNRDGSDGGCCLNGCRVAAQHHGGSRGQLQMAGHIIPWRRVHAGIELALPLRLEDFRIHELRLAAAKPGLEPVLVHAVHFWNPHVLVDLAAARVLLDCEDSFAAFPLAALAERLRREHHSFPQGVNVGLRDDSLVSTGSLRLRVEERGVGETAACGSGALAASAVLWQGAGPGRLLWQMAGGSLLLERNPQGQIHLSGRALVGSSVTLARLLRGAAK